jgi:hypothetical protein
MKRTKLKIKAKSPDKIFELTYKFLAEQGISEEEIDKVVYFQFDCLKEQLRCPVKPVIFLAGFGTFEMYANGIIKYLKSTVEKLKKMKAANEEIPEEKKEYFRRWWQRRNMAVRYAAHRKQNVKGFYKPINIKNNTYVSKKKT